MKISPLTPIAKTCADFLCANTQSDVEMVQEHILTSLGGLFNTILFGEAKEFILSSENNFTKEMADAVLFRINLKQKRNEFVTLLFKELFEHSHSGLTDENNWSLSSKNNQLVLINIRPEKESIPKIDRKRAVTFRFNQKV